MRSGLRVLAWARRHLGLLVVASAVVVLLAGAGFATLEATGVSGYGEGVWWALSLMTTVGFVGRAPRNEGAQVLAGALMVLGFGLMSLVTAAVSSIFVRQEAQPAEEEQEHFEAEAMAALHQLERGLESVARLQQELTEAIDRLDRATDGLERGDPRPDPDG